MAKPRKLKIGIIDIVSARRKRTLYGRVMHGNLASIMPQAVAVWCEEAGHEVHFLCFTGVENPRADFPADLDIVFITAFTQAAQLSYALSAQFRRAGVPTVLGGPHARCYPEDAVQYFDYVLGFTDKTVIDNVLADTSIQKDGGVMLSARSHPKTLPGLQARWKFVQNTLRKSATSFKLVPMIGSLGCPYTCSFCIDSAIPYQPLDFSQIRDDLFFLKANAPDPIVGWHDPNFGVRFDDYLGVIEEANHGKKIRHVAESSLSILTEPHVKRMGEAGFGGILPGIESWSGLDAKSKTRGLTPRDKMLKVSDHVNMILRHIPYLQANFVLGLDDDEGDLPFELTKEFLDRAPGAFPAFSLFSAFGEAAPLNLELQRSGRILPFPHHFLNNNQAMNVRPKNYEWVDFFERVIDLTRHAFSLKAMGARAGATSGWIPKWLNVVRAVSSEGWGRIKYHSEVVRRLRAEPEMQRFFAQESDVLPPFYHDRLQADLGDLWGDLPPGAMSHNAYAYMSKTPIKPPQAPDKKVAAAEALATA